MYYTTDWALKCKGDVSAIWFRNNHLFRFDMCVSRFGNVSVKLGTLPFGDTVCVYILKTLTSEPSGLEGFSSILIIIM